MNRKGVLWLISFFGVCLSSVPSASAVSRSYDWNTFDNTHYTVNIIIENPQFDTQFDVVVQLTLLSKAYNLNYTVTNWMQVLLSSSEKPLQQDSGRLSETVTLRNVGDSLQKVFHFQISSSQYGIGRGQGFPVNVVYRISVDEMDTTERTFFNHVTDNVNDPMLIQLSMPLLSTVEIIILLVIVVAAALIVARSIYLWMKQRRLEREQRMRIEVKEKQKASMLVENFECPYCHTLYDKKLEKCPHCGAIKKMG